jgi:Host cell surface-exposed lipoprotein
MGFIKQHKIISALSGLIVLIFVIAIAANAGSSKSNNAASSVNTAPAHAAATPATSELPTGNGCPIGMSPDSNGVCQPGGKTPTNLATAAAATTQPPASATAAATTQAPASPAMTVAQQQAVDAAQGYLSDGQGFSYESLLQQLTSSAGDGFATADAEFAINYLNPNWDQQAVDSAQGYLSDGQGFSYESLLQQLTSTSGSGFTEAQAEYAINHLNPNWDQQAVEAAKGYMQMGGFSQDSLIQQLTSSYGNGFTYAQAEYAANQVGL